jgi:WD40 repeat protein
VAIWQAVAATRAQEVAEKASDRADIRAAEAMRQAYRATIAAASAAINAHDPTTARQQLMGIPQTDRNWEWRHLYAKLDQASARLDAAGPALAVGPASDSQHVVSVTRDGRVVLTNLVSGEATRTLPLDVGGITDAAVSDDGLHVAVAWAPENNVGVADVNGDGKVRQVGQAPGPVSLLAIAPSGKHVAALYSDRVALWDSLNGAPPRLADAGGYWGLARFSGDGSLLAIGCRNALRVLDVASGKHVHARVLNNAGSGVDMSADNTQFITGGAGKEVHVIDLATSRDVETYSGHMGLVSQVALSSDQTRIASAGYDGTLRIWRRGVETPLAVFHMPASACSSLRFLPDGTRLLTRHANGEVRFWRADADDPDVLRAHSSYVYGVAFTADGSRLISGAWDRTLRVWDANTRACLRVLDCGPVGDPYVTSVAVSPDGRTIAAGHHKGGGQHSHIRLWNLDTGELKATFPQQLGEVRALAFSPDGAFLASGRTHAPLTLWNMRDASAPPEVLAEIGVVRGIAWSPDGQSLATTHDDGCIRIWDSTTRQMVRELRGHASHCTTCRFSPDGRLLASAAEDARLWDVASGKCLAVLDRHWDVVFSLAFSPDGTRLATGSRDTTIRIWDVAFGEEVAQLRGHGDYVYSLAFSPDGTMLASASGDSTVRIWDTHPSKLK